MLKFEKKTLIAKRDEIIEICKQLKTLLTNLI